MPLSCMLLSQCEPAMLKALTAAICMLQVLLPSC